MKTYQGLTIEEARRLWAYDPDTGVLTWRVNRYRRKTAGKVAGREHVGQSGYPVMVVTCNNKNLTQSIVIWGMQTGAWPEDGEVVSFKDKDSTNLKWENLFCEKMTAIQGLGWYCIRNTSGVRGVSWSKPSGKWVAQIKVDGKQYTLGRFKTIEEAAAARKAAEEKRNAGGFRSEARS